MRFMVLALLVLSFTHLGDGLGPIAGVVRNVLLLLIVLKLVSRGPSAITEMFRPRKYM